MAFSATGCSAHLSPVVAKTDLPQAPEAWEYLSEYDVSSHGMSPADAEMLATWWRQLEDPVLDRLIEHTLAGNLDLQSAAARVAEARARRGLSQSDLGPRVSFGLDGRESEPLGDGLSSSLYSASLSASWEADLFGAKSWALAASEADLAATVEQQNAARVSLVAEVVVAYSDLRVAEARLAVLDESIATREQTYQLTEFREIAGLTSRLEVDQALTSLEQTRAGRWSLEQGLVNARLRLELLAGELPGSFDELLSPVADEASRGVPTPPEGLAVGLPAEALERRPDLRAAFDQLDASLARLGVAEAARYPTLRLSGSIDSQGSDFADLFDADAFLANLLAGLTAPIFESGRIEQNILVEQARVEQQALATRDLMLEALFEVERALSSLRSVGEQITALVGAIEAAQDTADLADERYRAGLVDLLVVLDSQRTLLSLQEQQVAALGERAVAFSNLYRALGGGWEANSSDASSWEAKSGQGESNA
ncbi:MAG: efflux transporter outer membrane subunit [Acidobacteriota bacterium]